ncbi:MAG: beta-galactosidase GalB [Myxococcota bacterium]
MLGAIGRAQRIVTVIVASQTLTGCLASPARHPQTRNELVGRERVSLNDDWRFYKYAEHEAGDELIYDVRPDVRDAEDGRPADAQPTRAIEMEAAQHALKTWVLPSGNRFVREAAKRTLRPSGNPGAGFAFVQAGFDDSSWERVDLPHDWAIRGPFLVGEKAAVGGGMGRLPSPGVAWYRKRLHIPMTERSVFLEIDGAMSYAMVWLNGHLVGGWPFGYASWQLDLTPYVLPGGENVLAIRLDNPPHSSRWYPGGGIYRNVWLSTMQRVHFAPWGTFVRTGEVSRDAANVSLSVAIDNDSKADVSVEVVTHVYALDADGKRSGESVGSFAEVSASVPAGETRNVESTITLNRPQLWGPPPNQRPNLYVAVTTVSQNGKPLDLYETRFGVRSVTFDADRGVFVNGEHIVIRGANQHHDLGALGAAFNTRAAERQLEMLREMGCNAIRTAHNPPAPELLELTDQMGFLVIDESFDVWERKKTPLDFHLIFPDWHEQDLRAMIRRDRNHPSVIAWSIGNEVGEQYTAHEGAAVAERLHDIAREEDPTRPTTTAMNFAKPDMPLPGTVDVISLNYQGEGIRDAPGYAHLQGIRTPPLYPAFHRAFPNKLILSSENAAALSSRGEYLFPVAAGTSAPVEDGRGGDPTRQHVSAYELYTAPFGSSADKVLASLERHPYVAGGFVWSGWDYLGEPTPYYSSRSSYYGVIDLAGFKKDRFYLYQAHFRPDLPMVHILPHWTWPERVGEVTPVHVFTSGDAVELFLNGRSLGKKIKAAYEYRLRWDDVRYEPGELRAVAYKHGERWAEVVTKSAGAPTRVALTADRKVIRALRTDLSFIEVELTDELGVPAPRANSLLSFRIEGAGQIVATDNGDPTDFTPFPSHERRAFNGRCLVIVRGVERQPGSIRLKVESEGLSAAEIILKSVSAD